MVRDNTLKRLRREKINNLYEDFFLLAYQLEYTICKEEYNQLRKWSLSRQENRILYFKNNTNIHSSKKDIENVLDVIKNIDNNSDNLINPVMIMIYKSNVVKKENFKKKWVSKNNKNDYLYDILYNKFINDKRTKGIKNRVLHDMDFYNEVKSIV
mgnify:CR=1 FL=1|tara:strand:+ start:107 stop:571 length:465 start_codon:yes stop_codon:yes gene_type:complete